MRLSCSGTLLTSLRTLLPGLRVEKYSKCSEIPFPCHLDDQPLLSVNCHKLLVRALGVRVIVGRSWTSCERASFGSADVDLKLDDLLKKYNQPTLGFGEKGRLNEN